MRSEKKLKRPAERAVPAPRPRATKAASPGRIVLSDDTDKSRLLVVLIGSYLHRIEFERRRAYFGDLDLARIAEVIGIAGVEPGMRDAGFRNDHRSFESVVGIEDQRGVNASSIAEATGMPRETVRRKLRQLLDLGLVVEKSRAQYVLNPGAIQAPERQMAFARGLQETLLLINEALGLGLIKWIPAEQSNAS